MAARFVSSNSETRYASAASCSAITADDWNLRSVCTRSKSADASFIEEVTTNLEVLSDFTHETLERELADQQLRRLLVPPNLTKSHSSGAETMRLLHTTGSLQI
jgi:hypothetical protein